MSMLVMDFFWLLNVLSLQSLIEYNNKKFVRHYSSDLMAEIHRSYFYSIDCLRRRNLLCLLILNYTNIESMMSMFIITRNMCFSHQHKTPGISHCHILIFPILFSNNIVNLDLCDVFSFLYCGVLFHFVNNRWCYCRLCGICIWYSKKPCVKHLYFFVLLFCFTFHFTHFEMWYLKDVCTL